MHSVVTSKMKVGPVQYGPPCICWCFLFTVFLFYYFILPKQTKKVYFFVWPMIH